MLETLVKGHLGLDSLQKAVPEHIRTIGKLCNDFTIHQDKAKELSNRCREVLQVINSTKLQPAEIDAITKQLLPTLQAIQLRLQSFSNYNAHLLQWLYSSHVEEALRRSEVELKDALVKIKLEVKKYVTERPTVCSPTPPPSALEVNKTASETSLSIHVDLPTIEQKKPGVTLPWLDNKFVDNPIDLLKYLDLVPLSERNRKRDLVRGSQLVETALEHVVPIKPFEPRLFALIIGINDYVKGTKLRGACADAMAMEEYVKTVLHVPDNRITVLLDQAASRNAIIKAFLGLKDNAEIQRDDAILIFYAGHGAEILDGAEGRKIQSIVPRDCNEVDVHPIPDKTIGNLLAQIHEAKGDNITVIFDCCHSGGGCRDDGEFLTRGAEIDEFYRLPDSLDHEVIQLTRAMRPANNFLRGALDTHVLLAACSDSELARESQGRGQFTTALLSLLGSTPPEELTYSEVMERLKDIKGQNPQCEGNNRHRRLFDGKAPSRIRHLYKAHKGESPNQYVLEVGSVNGLAVDAEFDIYSGFDGSTILNTAPLSKMTATKVTDFKTILEHKVQGLRLPTELLALQVKRGTLDEPKLFVALDNHLLPVFDALVHLRTVQNQINFTLVQERINAQFEVLFEPDDSDGQFSFNILDERVTRHGLGHLGHRVPADFDNAVRVLSTAAHYFYHLDFPKSNLEDEVGIQFLQLKEAENAFSDRTAIGPNLLTRKERVVYLEVDEEDERVYGINMVNNTPRNMYPHVFYFDNSALSIKSYYGLGTHVAGQFVVDAPLRSKQSLKIGYGDGGANAFDFYIPDDQKDDVSFLKLIFSTKAVDLPDVECASPFEEGATRAIRQARRKDDDGCLSIVIPIVLKRK